MGRTSPTHRIRLEFWRAEVEITGNVLAARALAQIRRVWRILGVRRPAQYFDPSNLTRW